MDKNLLFALPGIESDEMIFIQEAVKDLSEDQKKTFILLYQGKRKDPQTIMICTILGFVVIAGIQRFMLGQVGMGILYLLTGGLCLVGTIVDLVNYKKMTLEFNQKVVIESKYIAQNMS
ncbi:TM2 domain-containing protein [soil metagenome]